MKSNKVIIIAVMMAMLLITINNVSAWMCDGNNYDFRYDIQNTTDSGTGLQISVNGTNGVNNGNIYWVKSEGTQLYLYCNNSDCVGGNITIGNVTCETSVNFEIEGTGTNPSLWSGVNTWHMNASDNIIKDVSGTSDIGIGGNPVTNVSGMFGNAVYFDGDGDYYNNSNFDGTKIGSSHTITAGVRVIKLNNAFDRVIQAGDNTNNQAIMTMSYSTGTNWNCGTWADDQDTGVNIEIDEWIFTTTIWNGTNVNCYVNGTMIATNPSTLTPDNPTKVDIGGRTGDVYSGTFGNWINATIDEVRIYDSVLSDSEINFLFLNSFNQAFLLGNVETQTNPPNITILSPSNDTFWTATDFNISFKADSSVETSFELYAELDGTPIYSSSSYSNNTVIQQLINVTAGVHNLTILASDSNGNSSESLIFTIGDFLIERVFFDQPGYETSNQSYNISVRINPDLMSSMTSTLFWNETNVGSHDSVINNATHFGRGKRYNMPLILNNETNVSVVFRTIFYFDNGSIETQNSTLVNQTLIFAYFINNITTNKPDYIEGEDVNITTNISDNVLFADLRVLIEFNITNFTSSFLSGTNPKFYFNSVPAPEQNITLVGNMTITPFLEVSFNGTSYNRTITGVDIGIFQIVITNCSTGIETIIFQMFEEINETAENGTLEIAIDALSGGVSKNFSFTFESNHTHRICLSPSFAEYTVNATVQFQGQNFPTRFYIIVNALINNVTNTINLFMLDENIGTLISPITVKDSVGNTLDDVVVQFQRFYVGQNKYQLVAMTLTDVNGIGGSFLQMNTVWYRIVLLRNGVVLRTIQQSLLTETSPTYSTSPLTIVTDVDFITGMEFGCTDTDEFISCTFVDPTGLSSEVCLNVEEVGIITVLPFNETCLTTSSGTLVVNITSLTSQNTSSLYTLKMVSAVAGTDHILERGSHDVIPTNPFGLLGVLMTAFLVIPISALGIKKPSLAILFGGSAIFISVGFGLLDMTLIAIGSLVTVIIVLVYKVAER